MVHKLEVDSIILEFGSHRVLQDVYFTNETGKITGILGRNGCGKSCLMNIITDHMYRYITDISDHLYVISNGKTYLTKGIEDLKALGYIN